MTRQRQLRGHTRRPFHTHTPGGGDAIPNLTAVRRCVDGGKIRYPNRREADLMLTSLDRTNPQRREKHSYRCPDCAGWHLTSWTTTEHEDYVAVAVSAAAPSYRIYPLTDYLPPAESSRAPRDLRSIAATPATVPTPAEVALRTASAPIEAPEPNSAASGEPTSPAVPSPAEVATLPPTPAALPTRPSMPSPAEVAAHTVPLKQAEAARREAEAARLRAATITEANTAATHRNPPPTLKLRDRLRTLLRTLAGRLRRS